jgi:outer membrane murein-binding lipoprotein Lpp
VPLVKAVQELNTKNEALQSEVDQLKTQLAEIKALLNK